MAAVISEGEISLEFLDALFARAFFKTSIDSDGDLYVSEGLDFPIWLSVSPNQKVIRYSTYVTRDAESSTAFTHIEANTLNREILLARFYAHEERPDVVSADYYMTFKDGAIDSQIIAVARRFSGAFVAGVRGLDR
ncbi:YbjN domain-containing protein [Methylobacterium oxalidis]|uniref:YbjN domain-containing protein n=1 Tax=Methylobacterium oxalidis TaxID=944322 RepID=UPI003315A8A1